MSGHIITLRSFETMGVPNTEGHCSCGETATFWPASSRRAGFTSDYDAARHWRCLHDRLDAAAVGGSPETPAATEEKGLIMKEVQPITGDVVLYEMPKDWHPELGIRIYPAIVLYPNPNYGHDGLDLQVFAAPYDYPGGYHASALPGEGPGRWQPKRTGVLQQPIRFAGPVSAGPATTEETKR